MQLLQQPTCRRTSTARFDVANATSLLIEQPHHRDLDDVIHRRTNPIVSDVIGAQCADSWAMCSGWRRIVGRWTSLHWHSICFLRRRFRTTDRAKGHSHRLIWRRIRTEAIVDLAPVEYLW